MPSFRANGISHWSQLNCVIVLCIVLTCLLRLLLWEKSIWQCGHLYLDVLGPACLGDESCHVGLMKKVAVQLGGADLEMHGVHVMGVAEFAECCSFAK